MIKIEEYKHSTENKRIEVLPTPKFAYLPLLQHIGKICTPLLNIGDNVLAGQRIAEAQAHVYAPIHSSISGKVNAIRDWPHPALGRCKAIIIEAQSVENIENRIQRTEDEIKKLSPQEIIGIIFNAGITGMGGAGFPTHLKLSPAKPVDILVINGAECEPYLTADYRLMLEKTEEIAKGIELIKKCLGVKDVIVAIEDNKPQAIKKFKACESQFRVKVLKSMYPQGGEKQLIKNILRREVPSGKLPFDVGVVVHNIGTCFAVYEALYLNKPLYERVVTVTGSCLSNPKNLLVRLGTPIRELIAYCGPLKEDPAKIIIGGPMMGIAQYSDSVPVIKSTTGIILMNAREAKAQDEEFCIRCGNCVRSCPIGLMPCLINLACEKESWAEAKSLSILDCIECGVCNYVCPANRMLTQSIKRGKLEAAK